MTNVVIYSSNATRALCPALAAAETCIRCMCTRLQPAAQPAKPQTQPTKVREPLLVMFVFVCASTATQTLSQPAERSAKLVTPSEAGSCILCTMNLLIAALSLSRPALSPQVQSHLGEYNLQLIDWRLHFSCHDDPDTY